jgi:small subunit ribosomal protein S8
MSMTDPIADMLARIRNAQMAGHASLVMPRSNIKARIAAILKNEGFLEGFIDDPSGVQGVLKLFLRYDEHRKGIIRGLQRVSRPSRRVYVKKDEIPRVRNGLGVSILTTPRGVLTDHQARSAGVGGEILCQVW